MRIGTDGDVSRRIALTQWQAQIDGQHTALHRLSSGLRINSAVDDAAGLAIAERMNAQIFGAAQGQRNAQDGINMLQMADGALQESVALVQRLRVIAVQAANGTWTDTQRAALQAMVEQGLAGLDELASRTTWNGIHLLDGSQAELTLQIGASSAAQLTVDLDGVRAADLGLSGGTASAAAVAAPVPAGLTAPAAAAPTPPAESMTWTYSGMSMSTGARVVGGTGGDAIQAGSYTIGGGGSPKAPKPLRSILLGTATVGTYDAATRTMTFTATGATLVLDASPFIGNKGAMVSVGAPVAQTAPTAAPDPLAGAPLAQASPVPSAGATPPAGPGISVATQESAREAIGRLEGALEILLEHRAELGASTSRLEHAVEALGVQELNLVAARSRLTDVDVAGETVKLAKIRAVSDLCGEAVRKAMLGQHAAAMLLLAAAWRPR